MRFKSMEKGDPLELTVIRNVLDGVGSFNGSSLLIVLIKLEEPSWQNLNKLYKHGATFQN